MDVVCSGKYFMAGIFLSLAIFFQECSCSPGMRIEQEESCDV